MSANEQEISILEENVYNSLLYYRLKKDLEYNASCMKKNEPIDVTAEKNPFVKIWNKSVVNNVRRTMSDRISVKRKNILDETERFEREHADKEYRLCDDEEAFRAILDEKLFANDRYGMARIVLGIRLSLDNTYAYQNVKESGEAVSSLLFGESDKLENLRKSVEEHYFRFAKEQLLDIEKGVMIGLGIAAVSNMLFSPIVFAGTAVSSGTVTAALSGIGGGLITSGIAKITASTVLSSFAFLGVCGLGLALCNESERRDLKKEFRKLTVKDLNLLFSIKATVIQEARKVVPDEVLKETIDDCLNWMNDLRSDAEYMLIVEKTDAVNAKKKIKTCNLLTDRLAEIVGI